MDLPQLLLSLGMLLSAVTSIDGIQQGTSPFNTCNVVPSYGSVSRRSSLWSAPSQLRLSATGRTGEMALSWVSAATLLDMTVGIGRSSTSLGDINISIADIHATHYVKPNGEHSPFIYHTVLRPLEPSTRYYYQVWSGGDTGMPTFATASGIYSFVTGPAAEDLPAGYPVRWLFLADHGTKPKSRATVDAMLNVVRQQKEKAQTIDLLLHGGDMAYGNGKDFIWDEWGKLMEPITAQLPYMVVAGNHELVPGDSGHENGLPLMHRFQMPYPNKPELDWDSTVEGKSLWYSFDWGLVHFIAISTEHSDDTNQMAWLKEDLQTASANKHVQWIITFGHAPIYTSNIRHGNKTVLRSWLSPLLDEYSVDLSLWGHDHSYERLFPLRNGRVQSTSYEQNPGTVHVICGSSGWDLHDCWKATVMSAFHTATVWGFLSLEASNSTAMRIDFINSQDLSIVDSVVVRRKRPRRGVPTTDSSTVTTGTTATILSTTSSSTTTSTTPTPTITTTPTTTTPTTTGIGTTPSSNDDVPLATDGARSGSVPTTSGTVFETATRPSQLNSSSRNATVDAAAVRYKHKMLFIVWLGCGVIIIVMVCSILRTVGVVPCDQEIPMTKDSESRKPMLRELEELEESEDESI